MKYHTHKQYSSMFPCGCSLDTPERRNRYWAIRCRTKGRFDILSSKVGRMQPKREAQCLRFMTNPLGGSRRHL